MIAHKTFLRASLLACAISAAFAAPAATTLVGFASLPADTFANGPTSGQFVASANGAVFPLVHKQAVQGFSAVLQGPSADSFYVMPDNGFGTKANSPDALLRGYSLRPEFRRWDGADVVGTGRVTPVTLLKAKPASAFYDNTFIGLSDPDGLIGFPIVAEGEFYPYSGSGPGRADIRVPAVVKEKRLLTGADLDIESVRRDRNDHLWIGDEFGPFLVKADLSGKVLRSVVPMPGVQSPDNPFLGDATPTLNRSNGFEGLAINAAGDRLYTLLEGTVTGDAPKTLRIDAFDVDTESYTGEQWLYKLEPEGTNIGDMTAVNDHQFIVIERNGTEEPRFKKLYLIDIDQIDEAGDVSKTELVDLMQIDDPHDLNQDGSALFTFPFVTIEDVLVLDAQTLLVINDNNYPGSSRVPGVPDPTEFIQLRLAEPLPLDERLMKAASQRSPAVAAR